MSAEESTPPPAQREIEIPAQPEPVVYAEHRCKPKAGEDPKKPKPPHSIPLGRSIDPRWLVGHCQRCGERITRSAS